MGDKTAIQWTDATYNPMTGCTKVSPGCAHCYAERVSKRWGRCFEYQFHADRLDQPRHWRKPRRIFVCSMSDLFQDDAETGQIDAVVDSMLAAPQHTYQILTKRAASMRDYWWTRFKDRAPGNIWLGVSIENQTMANKRIPYLLETRAPIRFLSCEPLLGPIHLGQALLDGLTSWLIVGGESGIEGRPMSVKWVRDIRDECVTAGVPFFFKQWGDRAPKVWGRKLDGRTWDEMPEPAQQSLEI